METLTGLTVIEMAGLGPAPFCAMMLGDLGARVIRIERSATASSDVNILLRNRESIVVDAKRPEGREIILSLVQRADVLVEGFRPGVMERLGLGPDACLERNRRLVYGRVTGWGQDGPLAQVAGHDINYVSLAGVVDAIGSTDGPPVPPLNLVGDYGGGGMFLAFGLLAAIWSAGRTGQGQVVDCAMVDGASTLMAEYYGFLANGTFSGPRATHLLDGGAPFYNCYETADGKHFSVGPLEDAFYARFLELLGLENDVAWTDRSIAQWPRQRRELASLFKTRTRDQWRDLFDGTDACCAPVLAFDEVADDPHIRARATLMNVAGVLQPSPSPRFSATPSLSPRPRRQPGQDTRSLLQEFGWDAARIAALEHGRVVAHADQADHAAHTTPRPATANAPLQDEARPR